MKALTSNPIVQGGFLAAALLGPIIMLNRFKRENTFNNYIGNREYLTIPLKP